MLEKELRANWDNVFYPEPEPEVETFGEEVQAVDDPVLLAAGPSGTVSDAGAAFGVFPQMKPRRAGASEVGANLPLLAADVAAGAVVCTRSVGAVVIRAHWMPSCKAWKRA
jgi:hypothetical protein